MIYENAVRLKVHPLEALVKIGDTISDIEEGLNAGTWTVAVAQTGNMIGLTEDEWHRLPQPEQAVRLQDARRKLLEAGAHYVIDTMAEIDEVVNQIEIRLQAGERP
jgi:phosphonoacetaldehyde hydrolase